MSDINEDQQSEVTRITNANEDHFADINSESNLKAIDTPESGLSATLNLTTTAIELKVGGSAKTNRRLIEMQALEKNVKWGYNSNCDFDLFKNQFFSLPCGENCTVYLKSSIGTASVAVSEK